MRKRKSDSEMIANVVGGIMIGACSVVIVALLFFGAVQNFGGGVSVLF